MNPRFLIIRFSSIGDIVLTSPVIRCLREQYPEAFICFATKKQYSFLVAENPYIDKVYNLDEDFGAFKDEIRKEGFDYLIDLHNNIRTKRLALGLRSRTYSFNKLNFQKWMMVKWHINMLPPIHIVDRYLATTGRLGVKNDGKGLDYFLPEGVQCPELPARRFAALAIGGQHATKKLPAYMLAELCSMIEHPIVLLGGKEDMEAARQILALSGNKDITDYTGKISLHESARIVQKADVLCTHDTGMMHIGAALNVPVISIWGNTIPEFGMTPYFPEHSHSSKLSALFEVKNLPCRPCSKIGYEECPKKHFHCMKQQDLSAIATHVNGILS